MGTDGGSSASTSGVVLAGGAGRRMGRDKREVPVDGQPLLEHALEAIRPVCDDVTVVTSPRRPLTPPRNTTVVTDRRDDQGPLAGLEAGLLAARHELVLVLAGDHPAASPTVLAVLVAQLAASPGMQAVALGTDRGPQPLVAAYRRDVHATVTRLLDEGERRARALLEHLEVTVVDEVVWLDHDPDGDTAVDLDTPQDVAAWERR